MINKNNLWFLTLFSLVLVLSVYYVTMPNELLVTNNNSPKSEVSEKNDVVVEIEESDAISALKVEDSNDEKKEIATIKEKLTNTEITAAEKNSAFEELKLINKTISKEETIEEKIKTDLKLSSFVKIDGDQIRIVIGSSEHSTTLANDIMRLVQSMYDTKMYISVQFQN